jgi:hypothetical protein
VGTACPSTLSRILEQVSAERESSLITAASRLGFTLNEITVACGMVDALVGQPPAHITSPDEARTWAANKVAWLLQARQGLLRPKEMATQDMKQGMYENGWLAGGRYNQLGRTKAADAVENNRVSDAMVGQVLSVKTDLERHHPLSTASVKSAVVSNMSNYLANLGINCDFSDGMKENLEDQISSHLSTFQMLKGNADEHHGGTLTQAGSSSAAVVMQVVSFDSELSTVWTKQGGAAGVQVSKGVYAGTIAEGYASLALDFDFMAISQDAGHRHAVGFAQAEADLMTFDDRFSARLKDWCVKQAPDLKQALEAGGTTLEQFSQDIAKGLGIQPTHWSIERRADFEQRQEILGQMKAEAQILDDCMSRGEVPTASQMEEAEKFLRKARYDLHDNYENQFYRGV